MLCCMSGRINQHWEVARNLGKDTIIRVEVQVEATSRWVLRSPEITSGGQKGLLLVKRSPSYLLGSPTIRVLTANLNPSLWNSNPFPFLIFPTKRKNFTAVRNLLKFSQQMRKRQLESVLIFFDPLHCIIKSLKFSVLFAKGRIACLSQENCETGLKRKLLYL